MGTKHRISLGLHLASVALIAGSGIGKAQTIDTAVGGIRIRATAVSDSVFRISMNAAGEASPVKSIFLDPNVKWKSVGKAAQTGTQRSIKTNGGELRIDTADGSYSLLDARGRVIVPPAPLVEIAKAIPMLSLAVHVGWPQDRPFGVYGAGNGAHTLLQKEVRPRVGNGIAAEPFFWSPAGFATFVIGQNDDMPARCDGSVENGAVTWTVPGPQADMYLIVAPGLLDASRSLLGITGRPAVPPKWTFGYLQSRWGWEDRAYIENTLKEFDARKLPVDAFIFDFEWYTKHPDYSVPIGGEDGFSDFDWNPTLFPDPERQIAAMHDDGIHFVGIRKPRLGNADTLRMARDKGWGFTSEPGKWRSRDLDFSNPDARAWYASKTIPLLKTGIDGWWDDEGEGTYSNYVYWNMAQREALDAVRPNARLWTINRAFQPGLARLGGAAWTGDIRATWEDLQRTPTSLLNWSVAGMPYAACDIGGFAGEDTPELLTRWMEAGTFFPVMRAHSDHAVTPHFPWLFGPDAEAAIRKALDLRYQLVPLFYSLAHESHETGSPIIRPLVAEYPNDPRVADLSSQWLVGDGLMAAPVLQPGDTRTVYLPDGAWYDFATGDKLSGGRELDVTAALDETPVYVRAGTVLPLAPVVQRTRDLTTGPLELRIYPGHDAQFTLVEDDGMTTAYTKGAVRRTVFSWNDATGELSWKRTGKYSGKNCFSQIRVGLVGHSQSAPVLPLRASGRVKPAGS
jgi:alpha-glucosidase